MENLRWILIFAGVAILVLLYFSGRSTSSGSARTRPARVQRDDFDADPSIDDTDPLLGQPSQHSANVSAGFDGFDEVDPRDLERPAAPRRQAARSQMGRSGTSHPDDHAHDEDLQADDAYLPPELRVQDRAPGLTETAAGALGGLSQKIESIGARLSGKRRERVAENPPPEHEENEPVFASKIITLHVVASGDAHFDGQALLNAFEKREYTFGEMNIFHSMHHGKTVFSVAKMIEPGWFDPHDLQSFATPGITFILQLPGPVAADTSFEVLLSEAFDIASELGGTVLDADHSTLSKQSAQHMREGVYEYMHRQKYFGSVAS